MALNNKLRSEVFGRDKAICAFSGTSLWMLDYGACAIADCDWADHIKPASRGGKDEVGNLVCASSFRNSRKRNNGADNCYFFRNGMATSHFFWAHGCISDDQVAVLRDHAQIQALDWYFNRALANLFIALYNEFTGETRSRTSAYWQRAALARLQEWRILGGARDFAERGLLRYAEAPDVKLMANAAECLNAADIQNLYRRLQRYYDANTLAFETFLDAKSPSGRERVLARAEKSRFVTEPTLAALRANCRLLSFISGPAALFLD